MMDSSMIYKTIRRSNTQIIILSIIALAIAIGVGVTFSLPYFLGKFAGPTEITTKELLSLTADSPTLYFRQVTGNSMTDTYYYEETVDEKTGRQVSIDAYFGGLEIEPGLWLLVRNPATIDPGQTTYVGGLTPITDSVAREVTGLAASENNVEMLPVMLDMVDQQLNWFGGAAVLLILLLGGIWGVLTFIGRSSNPGNHPTLKKLGKFGEVDTVVDSIEKELNSMPDEVGKLKLTKNWLVYATGSSFDAIPYRDLVWTYKMVTKGRYGTTYATHIADKHGTMLTVQDKEDKVNTMLQAVMARAPWIMGGYSEDIKKAWNRDRQQLVAAVEQRKAQYEAQQGSM